MSERAAAVVAKELGLSKTKMREIIGGLEYGSEVVRKDGAAFLTAAGEERVRNALGVTTEKDDGDVAAEKDRQESAERATEAVARAVGFVVRACGNPRFLHAEVGSEIVVVNVRDNSLFVPKQKIPLVRLPGERWRLGCAHPTQRGRLPGRVAWERFQGGEG